MRSTRDVHDAVMIGLLLASIGLGGCARLAEKLFVQPKRSVELSPGALGLTYEDIAFLTPDGVGLHGWWLPVEPAAITVLFLHDASGNIGDRVDLLRHFHDRLEVNVFLFDYRGFGKSSGSPNLETMQIDVGAARRLVRTRGWNGAGVVVYGSGLGAALALHSAAADPPTALVVEAAFPDLESAVRARHPFLAPLLAPWLRGRMDTLVAAGRLQVPALFLHGEKDEVVPIGLGWRVYDACPPPKWFRTITGSGHGETAFSGGRLYWSAWARFLERVTDSEPGNLEAP